jgi:DNA polymerase I-like protein with 3'-5' exonuclease and polymerase domains
MGADTFIETAGSKQLYEGARLLNYPIKTLKEFANYLLNQYNKPFPEIAQGYNAVKLEVVRNHTLTSPTGYTRYFFGDILKDHKVFRNAVAHAPQNLSVMIINKGVWRVYKELVLPLAGAFRLKAQIHDSIFFQNKLEIHDYVMAKMKECMDNPVKVNGRILSIPVDTNTSPKSWLDLKT